MKLFTRKECWVPTARGWLALAALFLIGAVLAIRFMHDFLSPNKPVQADTLIVESWLPDTALEGAAQEFGRGGYKRLIVSGPRASPGGWSPSSDYKAGPELAAAVLATMGLKTNVIVAVKATGATRDRTYSAALAVRKWLETTRITLKAANVYSQGPHARRSRLLYRKALGSGIKVGVIACPAASYDPKAWWSSSVGFRDVMGEALAYLYARTFF
jgi:hypothetical protein